MGRTFAIVGGALGLIVLALVVTPIATGGLAGDQLRAEVERMSKRNPAWQWQVESYERGLFSSKAKVHQSPAAAAGERASRSAIPWEVAIQHGPTVINPNWVRMEATPRLYGQAQKIKSRLFPDESPLTVTFRVGLVGDRHIGLHSPAVDSGKRLPFSWEGLEVNADIGREPPQIRFTAEMPALEAGLGPNSVKLKRFSSEGDMQRLRPFVWVGASRLDLGRLRLQTLNPNTGARFSLDLAGLTIENGSEAEDGLIHSQGEAEMSSAFTRAASFRQIRARWGSRNVDAQALEQLNLMLMDPEVATGTGVSTQALGNRLDKLPVARFLAAEPKFTLDNATVTTRDGTLEASGRAHFLPPPDAGSAEPADLAEHARAELSLAMPEAVLHKLVASFARVHATRIAKGTERFDRGDLDWMTEALARRRVHEVRQEGLVETAGNRVSAEARWDGQRFTVNGKPIHDLEALLGSRPGPDELTRR
ncbi:DUF945 family protein [Thiohalorhabdus sp.]|uniref:DUF945 family protein n=1 Tax=Thiohalorhabdus sp. TaxID=3094134 RepID=UPI002FC3B4AE